MVFTRGPRAIVAGHGGMAPTWPHWRRRAAADRSTRRIA